MNSENLEAKVNKIHPENKEKIKDNFKAVLNNLFNIMLSSLYSAVYFTIPVLNAPLETVSAIEMKFINWPTMATPAGPVKAAITFPIKNPEATRTTVMMDAKKEVFINFTSYS